MFGPRQDKKFRLVSEARADPRGIFIFFGWSLSNWLGIATESCEQNLFMRIVFALTEFILLLAEFMEQKSLLVKLFFEMICSTQLYIAKFILLFITNLDWATASSKIFLSMAQRKFIVINVVEQNKVIRQISWKLNLFFDVVRRKFL